MLRVNHARAAACRSTNGPSKGAHPVEDLSEEDILQALLEEIVPSSSGSPRVVQASRSTNDVSTPCRSSIARNAG